MSKASQNQEVIAFADHWQQMTGHDPALLIFDSKLTTQAVLAELDDRGIGFITLRARHPGVTAALAALPASAWATITLGRARAEEVLERARIALATAKERLRRAQAAHRAVHETWRKVEQVRSQLDGARNSANAALVPGTRVRSASERGAWAD